MKKNNMSFNRLPDLTLADRVLSSTPSFFRKVRTFGIVLGLVGAALLAAPIGLPALVVTIGGYLALAGGITQQWLRLPQKENRGFAIPLVFRKLKISRSHKYRFIYFLYSMFIKPVSIHFRNSLNSFLTLMLFTILSR